MDVKDLPQDKRQKCEIWTRVMGYHRPVSSWNDGKQSEYYERKYFAEPNDITAALINAVGNHAVKEEGCQCSGECPECLCGKDS